MLYTAIYLYAYSWYPFASILVVFIYCLNSLVGLILFSSSRESYSKLSWFILIILLPIVGASFFLIFGVRFKGRQTSLQYREKYNSIYSLQKKQSIKFDNKWCEDIMDQVSINVNHPICKSNIELITSDQNYFQDMFDVMKNAKKFIHIHYYVSKPGEIFEEFSSILIKKAKEGVEVRIIIDDIGHWALPWYKINELTKAGIEVAIWAKVRFPFISGENGYRTHRKILLVDGNILFTGGINIADEYTHLSKKYGYWYDLQIKMQGSGVESYSLLFINDWHFMKGELLDVKKYLKSKASPTNSNSLMVESGPDNLSSQTLDTLLKLIYSAKKSIYLVSPYFVPEDNLISALRIASASGVDIKIIIPGLADKKNVMHITKYYARLAHNLGVKFYIMNNAFVHSKFGIIDGKIAYVGTLNLDIRSFYQQFEVITVLTGRPVKDLNMLFLEYLKYSTYKEFKLIKIKRINNHIYSIIVKIFAPLM